MVNCVSLRTGVQLGLDVVAFLYSLYSSMLFFAVVMMWVFASLITIYVAITSGQRQPQIFALFLGVPLIGLLMSLLEEMFVVVVRVLRLGFTTEKRGDVMGSILYPVHRSKEESAREGTRVVYYTELVISTLDSWITSKIPFLRMLTTQHKLAALFLFLDTLFLLIWLGSDYGGGFTIRTYVCLLVMLFAGIIRFLRCAPMTFVELKLRLNSSRGVRFVKYVTLGSCTFILLSTFASGLFSKSKEVYTFSIVSLFLIACWFVCIVLLSYVIYPFVWTRIGGQTSGDHNTGVQEETKVSSEDKQVVLVFLSWTTILVCFVVAFISRGSGAGNIDDESVSSGQRWGALILWTVMAIILCVLALGDGDRETEDSPLERHLIETPLPLAREDRDHSMEGVGSAQLPKEGDYSRRHSTGAGPTNVVPTKTTKSFGRVFISIVCALFFIAVGGLTCLNNATDTPYSQRSYDFSVLDKLTSPYPLCNGHWGGGRFNATDMILLAKAAYYGNSDDVSQALNNWFDMPFDVPVFNNSEGNTSVGVHAFHVVFPAFNRSAVSALGAGVPVTQLILNTPDTPLGRVDLVLIRGSHTGLDWLQDGYVWGDAVFFSVFSAVSPFTLPESVVSSLIKGSKYVRYGVFGDISYFTELRGFTNGVIDISRANGGSTLVVGHSLGGGLAQLAGAALGVEAFAVSGVGMGYQADSADFDVSNIRSLLTNILPYSDPVPKIDLQLGELQNIDCYKAPSPLGCHSLATTFQTMSRACGDIRNQHDIDGPAPGIPAQAAVQVLLWLVVLVGMFITFKISNFLGGKPVEEEAISTN